MAQSVVGRADLLRVLALHDDELQQDAAQRLQFRRLPSKQPTPLNTAVFGVGALSKKSATIDQKPPTDNEKVTWNPAPVKFWQPTELRLLEGENATSSELEESSPDVEVKVSPPPLPQLSGFPVEMPAHDSLAPVHDVMTRLRPVIARNHQRGVDVDKAVQRLSRGRFLYPVPRRVQRTLGSQLFVILDRSRRLTPYWDDQVEIAVEIQRYFPTAGVTFAALCDGEEIPYLIEPHLAEGDPAFPELDATVLVLGDLGRLEARGYRAQSTWRRLGQQYKDAGNPCVALTPAATEPLGELADLWTVTKWDAFARQVDLLETDKAVERLLGLISHFSRIEPALLRAIRRLIPEGRIDAGLESRVWQHTAVKSDQSEAATLYHDNAQEFRQRFARETPELRRAVAGLARQWRPQQASVWCMEAMGIFAEYGETILDPSEAEEVLRFCEQVAEWIEHYPAEATQHEHALQWLERMIVHDAKVLTHPATTETMNRIWESIHRRKFPDRQLSTYQIACGHSADVFTLADSGTAQALQASPIATLTTKNRQIGWGSEKDDFWAVGESPAWAKNWGTDQYGAWAEFEVATGNGRITQRMRWIAAGTFLMGSPDGEPGRWDDEGPQHKVTISRGFWMFDTPCTQSLWQAVMGENPSQFQSPTRPVEQVSWQDCQQFLQRLHEFVPGLDVNLPSEAEWEFACRAGTTEATYAGLIEIFGENDAPVLHTIAWYGGNSGLEFELENGVDASGWSEKQYEFETAGTHSVGLKNANPAGLHDMLGNVWEWCRDAWRDGYDDQAVVDPEHDAEASARRVIRGGSWRHDARCVRAACRSVDSPEVRNDDLGFRCRVQGSEPSQQAVQRAMGGRSQRSGGDSSSASDAASKQQPFLEQLARIPLSELPRPAWASDWGRDDYGLWAEFQMGDVTQRLRLIPPGTFRMGSPDEETGRYSDEGPQHEVTIREAFWMFDAPCTQMLWRTIMGENPSRFKSDDRPVETVSWNAVRKFIEALNEMLAGLEGELPTEAQWEYACRAGTTTATYAGDLNIIENRAAELDSIAWYWANSDRSTHPIREKHANEWGLFDTLGSVWEWCLDGRREYSSEAIIDPVGPTDASARRVIRGGSWSNFARFVRAACRSGYSPEDRFNFLGFRCRVQASEVQQVIASRERRSQRSGGASERASNASWISLIGRTSDRVAVPATPTAWMVTDQEELALQHVTKPAWASAIGRDRFGLWAEFEVPARSNSPGQPEVEVPVRSNSPAPRQNGNAVTQRLRWIPPGRFQFGSPKAEPGYSADCDFEPRAEIVKEGFWMFDTPCTQALWEAVMSDNSSEFQSPKRPVEHVNWWACQDFLEELNTFGLGLQLTLPTEIEWEYACRAGTTEATYAGPLKIAGEHNAPILDAIAWYGGNCGIEYELGNGYDTSRWPEKQYKFEKGGTHPVGLKLPNNWGLYDTLGNVWEWCEDIEQESGEEESDRRVMRGGSWEDTADNVRAACRDEHSPDFRDGNLGFRCRVQ